MARRGGVHPQHCRAALSAAMKRAGQLPPGSPARKRATREAMQGYAACRLGGARRGR